LHHFARFIYGLKPIPFDIDEVVAAPFDFAQGRLLKSCPFKAAKSNRRSFDFAWDHKS
jgi:hypothetical protein